MTNGGNVAGSQDVEELVRQLRAPNNKDAYGALKVLEELSDLSDAVYAHIEAFIEMMSDSNSYIRTRGLVLISCNAKWDAAGRIDEVIGEYLTHVTDEKPITARQCVKSLAALGEAKPELIPVIVSSLKDVDLSRYPSSMRPLVQGDIRDVLIALDS